MIGLSTGDFYMGVSTLSYFITKVKSPCFQKFTKMKEKPTSLFITFDFPDWTEQFDEILRHEKLFGLMAVTVTQAKLCSLCRGLD